MELRNINTFLHIAELHSFSRTARQLGYSQSAVSSQIAQLEAELGAPLFDRVGKTVRLTDAGRSQSARASDAEGLRDAARTKRTRSVFSSGSGTYPAWANARCCGGAEGASSARHHFGSVDAFGRSPPTIRSISRKLSSTSAVFWRRR